MTRSVLVATWVPLIRDLVIIILGLGTIVVGLVMLREVRPLLRGLNRLVDSMDEAVALLREQSKQVGELLLSARALTDALNETHRQHLVPTVIHVERASADLSRTAQRAAQIVEEGYQVTHETVERVRHYRDRVFRPVIELASLWYGMRAVLRAVPLKRLVRRRKRTKRSTS